MRKCGTGLLAIVLTLMIALTGCSPSADGGKIKLRIVTMFGGTDPAKKTYDQALKDFMKAHPDVEIVDESMTATGDDFRTKVKTDFASGNEPDVTFFFTGAEAEPIVQSGAVIPYDELFAKDKAWGDAFSENVKTQMKAKDDKIYAVPVTGFYEGLFVNKSLFEKYNLELPTDWDKFNKAVEIFAENGIVPIAGSLEESYYLIEHFILSAGGPAGHNSKFDNGIHPTWAQGLEQIKEVYDKGGFPKDALTMKDAQAQELFKNKQAAMIVNGSWILGGLTDKEDVEVLPFPVLPGGKANPKDLVAGYTSGFYLSKKSHEDKDKKGLALELIKYLTSKDMIKKFAEANGGVPAVDVTVDSLPTVAKNGHKMVQEASSLSLPIDAQISAEAFNEIRKGIPYIVQGKKTIQDVLSAAQKIEQEKTKK
ncbi:ABC transporter substrate-binding protein [Laceyella putida]|uniref:ABC transporter substrate-binding protein n=1 Tax=Laceyella putida TaxID=110101 RepID=A0ABW2RKD3_9BACL